MTAEHWLEQGLPLDCLDPLTGKLSRAVLVSFEVGPDEDEDDELPAEAA